MWRADLGTPLWRATSTKPNGWKVKCRVVCHIEIFRIFVAKVLKKMEKTINVEERVSLARQYFESGYNCAQAVVMAYNDIMSLTTDEAAKIAAPFGGGMGRMREVCGTVSAMTMLAGAISPSFDPKNMEERKANYALVQEFASEFRNTNGDIVCRRLLGLEPREEQKESAMPSERTAEYSQKHVQTKFYYNISYI